MSTGRQVLLCTYLSLSRGLSNVMNTVEPLQSVVQLKVPLAIIHTVCTQISLSRSTGRITAFE